MVLLMKGGHEHGIIEGGADMHFGFDIRMGIGIFLYRRCSWFKHRYGIDVPVPCAD